MVASAGERPDDLFLLGEAPLLVLGEDHRAVDDHVELAGFPRLQGGIEAGLSLDGGRETRSPGFVVSDVAVLDDDALAHAGTMAKRRAGGKGEGSDVSCRVSSPGARGAAR